MFWDASAETVTIYAPLNLNDISNLFHSLVITSSTS